MSTLIEKLETEICNLRNILEIFRSTPSVANCEQICVRSRLVYARFLEMTCWKDEVSTPHQSKLVDLFGDCAAAIEQMLPSKFLDDQKYIVDRLNDRASQIEYFDIAKDLAV